MKSNLLDLAFYLIFFVIPLLSSVSFIKAIDNNLPALIIASSVPFLYNCSSCSVSSLFSINSPPSISACCIILPSEYEMTGIPFLVIHPFKFELVFSKLFFRACNEPSSFIYW